MEQLGRLGPLETDCLFRVVAQAVVRNYAAVKTSNDEMVRSALQ